MFLDPFGGSSAQSRYNCSTITDDYPGGAFALRCPQQLIGLPGPSRAWNASDSCCENDGGNVNDSGYIRDVIGEVRSHLPIDNTRIALIAESNGEFLARKIACEHPESISTIIGLCGAGRTTGDLTASGACVSSPLVSSVHLHGTGDGTVPYVGGVIPSLAPAMQPAIAADPTITPNTSGQWASINGCGALAAPYDSIHLITTEAGGNTSRAAYASCPAHGETEFWLYDVGHCTNQTYAADTCTNYFTSWIQNHPSVARACPAGLTCPRRNPRPNNRARHRAHLWN